MSKKPSEAKDPSDSPEAEIPALFATIHFRSDARPDGYTDEDIAEMNRLANQRPVSNGKGK